MHYKVGKVYKYTIYRDEEYYRPQCMKIYSTPNENLTTNSQTNYTSVQTADNSRTTDTPVQDVVGEQTDYSKQWETATNTP